MESLLTSLTPPMPELLFISYAIFTNNNNFSRSLSPPCCCLLKISFALQPVSVKLPWQTFHVLPSHRDPRDPQKCQLELCSHWSCAIWPCGQCHLATKVLLLLCPTPNSAFKPTGFLHPHSSSHFSFWWSADNSPYMSSSKCVSGHTWKGPYGRFFFFKLIPPPNAFCIILSPFFFQYCMTAVLFTPAHNNNRNNNEV